MNLLSDDAIRLQAALEHAGVCDFEESVRSIQLRILNRGLEQAVRDLNARWGTRLCIGADVLYCTMRQAFWSRDAGWVKRLHAATGFQAGSALHTTLLDECGAPDARTCSFAALEAKSRLAAQASSPYPE